VGPSKVENKNVEARSYRYCCTDASFTESSALQLNRRVISLSSFQKLTGGTLLSRDSEYIVFYRGKDFLPLAVSTAIEERRKNGGNTTKVQEESHEERKMSDSVSVNKEMNFSDNDEKQMDSAVISKLEAKLSLVTGRYIFLYNLFLV
jgi:hypothetical protein